MSANCLFCRIANGEIPANKVFEDEWVVAFHDIHPQAPTHVLVIPRKHVATMDDLPNEETALAGVLFQRTAAIARQLGVAEKGYRVIVNNGEHGGQEVFHLHVHILGGRGLGPMLAR